MIAVVLATCAQPAAAEQSEREPMLQRAREGLRYARTNRVARLLIGGEALAVIFFTLIVPIEIVYAAETLETDDVGYGILLSSWGAGIVLGSIVFLGVAAPLRRACSSSRSTLAIGCAYLGMAVARELWVACAFSVLGGLGNGVQWVSVMTALQEVDAGRPPGARHRPARVGHVGHDRRRLPDRRRRDGRSPRRRPRSPSRASASWSLVAARRGRSA